MPILWRGGVPLFYEVHGAADGQPPVLLTHGYSASSAMWEPNLPTLGRNRRLITWDIRGHGRSDSPEDPALYSEELSVGDMLAVLDAEGVDRAVLGGLSLGGYLSLAFHLRYPERVAALMLFDTGPGFRRDDTREEWNRRVERTAAAFEMQGQDLLRDRPKEEGSQRRNAVGLARAARGIMAQHGSHVIDSLPDICVPTLVLV
ncbi:MAG TPA: alpha/beta fold hydrolase, partial [Candidatus Dormibacteraeota bacterium]|nr:alpha/beta fold hydrolase [Candidatus Dormibacteraeota bacterium]